MRRYFRGMAGSLLHRLPDPPVAVDSEPFIRDTTSGTIPSRGECQDDEFILHPEIRTADSRGGNAVVLHNAPETRIPVKKGKGQLMTEIRLDLWLEQVPEDDPCDNDVHQCTGPV